MPPIPHHHRRRHGNYHGSDARAGHLGGRALGAGAASTKMVANAATLHKPKKFKAKKTKKLKPKFKKAVRMALDSTLARGTYTEFSYGQMFQKYLNGQTVWIPRGNFTVPGGSSVQLCFASSNIKVTPNPGPYVTNTEWGWDFDTWYFSDHADVLWSGKVATQGLWVGPGPSPTYASQFNNLASAGTLRLHIRQSYVKYRMKNVTQRNLTVEIWTCSPKIQLISDEYAGLLQAAGSTSETLSLRDPVYYWAQCSYNDYVKAGVGNAAYDATRTQNYAPGGELDTGSGGQVANGPTLYSKPTNTRGWSKYFSYELKEINLEPGQVYEHVVYGPKDMLLDYAKFYQQGGYTNGGANISSYMFDVQKFSRFTFFIVRADLIMGDNVSVGVSGTSGGRFAELNSTSNITGSTENQRL